MPSTPKLLAIFDIPLVRPAERLYTDVFPGRWMAPDGDRAAELVRSAANMTMDKSLKMRRGLARARSVLNRAERIQRLKAADRWQEGNSPFGLAKVRVYKLAMKKKKKKKEEEEEGAEGTTAAAAAPAEGAKKEAGKKEAGKKEGGKK
jgi:small basic protein (TIGR04137 family)